MSYDLHPSNVQIEPGRAAFVKATLKPRQIIWFGSKEERPYTLAVQRSGVDSAGVEGTYVQRGFLPRWLATFLGVFMALALTFVMLWIAYKPQVKSGADEQVVRSRQHSRPVADSHPDPDARRTRSTRPVTGAGRPRRRQWRGRRLGGGGGSAPTATKKAPTPVVPAMNILLRNPTTKKCADIPNYDKGTVNGPVRQFTCNETTRDNQRWNLEVKDPKGGPGGRALFQIRNVKDQLCMDLPDYGARPIRTAITEFTCDGTTADNQLWWIQKQQSGAYWIRNFASNNKCLDVAGYTDGGNDANLTIFDCTNTDDQEWLIVHTSGD